MIGSILDEIRIIRGNRRLNINRKNISRYRVLVNEDNGSTTAYYFSTPIYNLNSRKLVDPCFCHSGDMFTSEGSNADINVTGDEIILKNSEGTATIGFGGRQYYRRCGRTLAFGGSELYPTLNGVAVKAKCSDSSSLELHIRTDKPFTRIRDSSKYFALMSEEFRPFMTVSAIGMFDSYGKLCSPIKISYQKINDNDFIVNILPAYDIRETFMFEVNLYEPKLFQDTTVESKNPLENNAFGGIGFIGKSATYGEQWLYSRLDISKMSEILSAELCGVKLHIPKYIKREFTLAAFEVAGRFCSFGSNWDNKIELSNAVSESRDSLDYCSMDITDLMVNKKTHDLKNSEGLIIRSKLKDNGYLAIATGDNYYTPQILEINYKQI